MYLLTVRSSMFVRWSYTYVLAILSQYLHDIQCTKSICTSNKTSTFFTVT